MIKAIFSAAVVAAAFPAHADAQSERYARQLGSICNLDMTKPETVKYIKHQPGYYWLLNNAMRMPGNDMPIRYIVAAKPAINCERASIIVNESMAEKLIAKLQADEAGAMKASKTRKEGS